MLLVLHQWISTLKSKQTPPRGGFILLTPAGALACILYNKTRGFKHLHVKKRLNVRAFEPWLPRNIVKHTCSLHWLLEIC